MKFCCSCYHSENEYLVPRCERDHAAGMLGLGPTLLMLYCCLGLTTLPCGLQEKQSEVRRRTRLSYARNGKSRHGFDQSQVAAGGRLRTVL